VKIFWICVIYFQISVVNSSEIFVVNSGSETLSKIDLETGNTDNVFAVLGEIPNKIAFFDGKIYAINSGDNSIQVIDRETGETLSNIFIESSSNPYDIIIEGSFAYVTGLTMNKIYKVSLVLGEVVGEFFIGNNPSGMAVIENILYVGNTDYITGYTNCSFSRIDLADFFEIDRIACGINPQYLTAIDNKLHISCNGNWGNIYGKVQIWDPEIEEFELELQFENTFVSNIVVLDSDVFVGDSSGENLFRYSREDFSFLNSYENPITPGAQLITSSLSNIYTLNGEWGQNFRVNKLDENFGIIETYNVALYGTDIKFHNSETESNYDTTSPTMINLRNFPNPFNPITEIVFELHSKKKPILEIYNIKGEIVDSRGSGSHSNGKWTFVWEGRNMSNDEVGSGIYFFRVRTDEFVSETKKMILLR